MVPRVVSLLFLSRMTAWHVWRKSVGSGRGTTDHFQTINTKKRVRRFWWIQKQVFQKISGFRHFRVLPYLLPHYNQAIWTEHTRAETGRLRMWRWSEYCTVMYRSNCSDSVWVALESVAKSYDLSDIETSNAFQRYIPPQKRFLPIFFVEIGGEKRV